MRYAKPAITFEQQADQLLTRGMTGDRSIMIRRFAQVSYYRLSGYWYPFRQADPANPDQPLDDFRPATTFNEVWNRYVFDRRLRLLVLDAIERIEVAVRTQLAYQHAHEFNPFAYANLPSSLPGLKWSEWLDFCASFGREMGRSKDSFVKHFAKKYGSDHGYLPVWMAIEIMTFGSVLTFFSGSPHRIKQAIASSFDMPAKVFASWLLTLNTVRNICAHHGRLWNREIGTAPLIPLQKDYPEWHQPRTIQNNRVFAVLTISKWCLDRVAPQSRWVDRCRTLLNDFPAVPRVSMGFPADWELCPIWTPPAAIHRAKP